LKKYSISDFIDQNCFNLNGASRAFRKSVYSYFGPLMSKSASEDSTTFLRCLMLGNSCDSSDFGIKYRIHGQNYYASNKKYNINYKRMYWQYLKDIKIALLRGAISSDDAERLKKVLRRRLKQLLLDTGFALANSKVSFYMEKILFSKVFGLRQKLSYLLRTMKCLKH
jgi:hypothetical protein